MKRMEGPDLTKLAQEYAYRKASKDYMKNLHRSTAFTQPFGFPFGVPTGEGVCKTKVKPIGKGVNSMYKKLQKKAYKKMMKQQQQFAGSASLAQPRLMQSCTSGSAMPKFYHVPKWSELTPEQQELRKKRTKSYYMKKALRKNNRYDEYKTLMTQWKRENPKLRRDARKYMKARFAKIRFANGTITPKDVDRVIASTKKYYGVAPPSALHEELAETSVETSEPMITSDLQSKIEHPNPVVALGMSIVKQGTTYIRKQHKISPKPVGGLITKADTLPTSGTFWPRVGKIVRRNLQQRFAQYPQVKTIVKEFIDKYGAQLFADGKNKLLSKKGKSTSPLMLHHIIKPMLYGHAKAMQVPVDQLKPLIDGPLNVPAEGGFLGTVLKILTNPLTKKIVGKVAKVVLPPVAKKVQHLLKKKTNIDVPLEKMTNTLLGIKKSSPIVSSPTTTTTTTASVSEPAPEIPIMNESSLQRITAPTASPIEHTEQFPTTTTASGYNIGSSTADLYSPQGGKYALTVFEHAKKMA